MDRNRWIPTIESTVALPCPHCGPGSIHFERKSLHEEETPDSKRARSYDDWEPEWIETHFVCLFRCGNPTCAGAVFAVGKSPITWNEDENSEAEAFTPKYFMPAPPIISIPQGTPDAVRDDVVAAFSLYWADPAAASNRLRAAVEGLLTDLSIPRFAISKSRRRRFLQISERIARLRVGQPDVATQLDAIKFVGHEGSHASNVTKDDVLDAFEILESVLDAIYVGSNKRIAAMVKKINERRKPRSVKRSRRRKNPWA